MYRRILTSPLHANTSFFLFGPRGTGKTTWLRAQIPHALFIDLLDSSYYQDLLVKPHRLADIIGNKPVKWIVLDEIQRVPELLNEVHRLIETTAYRFVLTGSSARALRRKGVNLLAGRAIQYHFYPLTAMELAADFSLEKSLKWGHLPTVFGAIEPAKYLTTYVQTYLREEVLQEGLTRNIGQFSRFLEIASFSQGCVLNMSEISRELGVDRMTVVNYFSILEDLLIGYMLPVFSKRSKRRLTSHSKFYFFDTGVFRAIRPMGPLDSPEEAAGPGLETLVLQELQAINAYFELGYTLFYWRTATGQEVDFVLYGQGGLIAIEVKRSHSIQSRDLRGLNLFKSDYPIAQCYCFYGGSREEQIGDVSLIPIHRALPQLKALLTPSVL